METKPLVVSTLLAGTLIFFWGASAHTLPPEPITPLKDTAALDAFLAAQAPNNATYMDARGVMIAVNFASDRHDKSQQMGPMLGLELATNLVQALLLTLVLSRFQAKSILSYGLMGLAIGLLAWISTEVSYWNWYGISFPLVAMGLLDAGPGFFFAGSIIGWQMRKAAA